MTSPRWPSRLWIIRHGESAGNVARYEVHAHGADRIELSARDVDIVLSQQGEEQVQALDAWFAKAEPDNRPDVMLASPYPRACATAMLFRDASGAVGDEPIYVDERLREKEFGILDALTVSGGASIYPDQAQFRRLPGKFHHRPPGGESWCGVIVRLRALMGTTGYDRAALRETARDDRRASSRRSLSALCDRRQFGGTGSRDRPRGRRRELRDHQVSLRSRCGTRRRHDAGAVQSVPQLGDEREDAMTAEPYGAAGVEG